MPEETSKLMEDDRPTQDLDETIGIDEPIERKPYNIMIHTLDYGYNVKIGCQVFAIETVSKVIKNIEAYLNDPKAIEKEWGNNKKLL